MRVEVLYISRGGFTKVLAEAIAKEAKVEAKDLKKNPRVSDFDLVFIGSGNYASPDNEIMELPGKLKLSGKDIALFGTSGGQGNVIKDMEELFIRSGAKVVGEWGCKGKFLFFSKGGPSDADLRKVREFAREMLDLETAEAESQAKEPKARPRKPAPKRKAEHHKARK